MRLLIFILILCSTANAQAIINPYIFVTGGGGVDADAADYIARVEAAGRTLTPTEEGYINTYFTGLKSAGVWTKIVDRGLLVWGVAAANAEKFKGGTDVSWNGTITHASTGVTSNGTTGYGNLNVNLSTSLTLNSSSISLYCRTNSASASFTDMGAASSTTSRIIIFLKTVSTLLADHNSSTAGSGRFSATNSDSRGYYCNTRISSTDMRVYRNGTQLSTTNITANNGTLPNLNAYLMAYNNAGSAANFTTREYALWSIESGLTGTEISNDNTLTEAFMDALGIGIQ